MAGLNSLIKVYQACQRFGVRRMRDRFDALAQRIAEAYTEVPVEEGLAEIDAVVMRERAG